MRRRPRSTLAGQLFALQLAIIAVVLVAVAAVSLAQSAATFERVEGRRVAALAEQVASSPLVRASLAETETRTGLATLAQSLVTQTSVSSVSFAETDLDVRVSTDPSLEGAPMPLGDPRVASGASWSGTLELDGAAHLVSQVPVLGESSDAVGAHLGSVMVAERAPSTWERLQGTSSYLLTYLGIALLVGLVGSWLLSRRIKRQTRGLEPGEIAGLAEHREAMLRGIAEGVIALDPQHRITLVNEVARQLLDLPEHAIGTSIEDLRIEGRLREVLAGENTRNTPGLDPEDHVTAARDEVVIRRGRVLVMNTMRVVSGDRVLGTVTTMRDRTALADLEREIGSFRSTSHVLRAQAHEFANQLHTISGLIQIGEIDEVVRYVDTVTERRHALDLTLSSLVRDPTIAALLMAKVAAANERRVDLVISEESGLERLEAHDAADVATVLGNLVDNALEHAPRGTASPPWVRVRVRQDQSSVEIVVTDSGPGIPDELVSSIFEHGITTKRVDPMEHGVGLALTRLVCRRRGGEITVEREDGATSFVARLGVSTIADTVAAEAFS
ncbi:MAG TPA: ATP-binding protein [Ornithinibacter sp.]|nr:Spo0B domain-containing protein [Dermatophilaceae bacterium]MBU9943884.1 Spo0B domain-containing protein [Dermatophilaceae bacterium]HQW74486.1 ATP-binding protein [Ornithinibacter sp.]HQZ09743.1 ATP-binding protein [Ornithinibacter sp.]